MKILKAITILALVALLVACSMKKPDTDNMVDQSSIIIDVTPPDSNGIVTYTTTFQANMTGLTPLGKDPIPKLVKFTSNIKFDTNLEDEFKKPAYAYNVKLPGGNTLPEQKIGGVSYYDYCKTVLPKETVGGIKAGIGKLGGLSETNLKTGVNQGNQWLSKAVGRTNNTPGGIIPNPSDEDKKQFQERGVKFDEVDFSIVSYQD